jgi:hypothetical protein
VAKGDVGGERWQENIPADLISVAIFGVGIGNVTKMRLLFKTPRNYWDFVFLRR